MLVLTRKIHQIIVVGDHTLITFAGYNAGVYTFTIADDRTADARVVQMRAEDEILVEDGVTMKLLGRKAAQARLGFAAPPSVTIDRLEVRQA